MSNGKVNGMTYGYPGVPPAQPAERREPRVRDLDPPKLVSGKPHEHWTEAEQRDALLWKLGPRFRQGLKPPPTPEYYIPPVPGSESDVQRSHQGCAAREIY
jgi:hypothetical protein